MPDPFASALEALFGAAGSEAAVYTKASGEIVLLRVIRGAAERHERFGSGEVAAPAARAEIAKVDVPEPVSGERLDVLGPDKVTVVASFRLAGQPELDVEGLTWLADLEPLP